MPSPPIPPAPDPAGDDARQRIRQAFIARALRSRAAAQRGGDYTSAAAVLAELEDLWRAAEAARQR